MYNNRELVPEHPAFLRALGEESARRARKARANWTCLRRAGRANAGRVSGAAADAPVLVFIHGGYWRALDKSDHSFIAPAFTRDGACVVIPNYALCPAVTIPQITLQMVRAVAWTWHNIARFGGDPRRIKVAGHSAGGQLAAMMLACLWPQHEAGLPRDVSCARAGDLGLHDLEPIMRAPFLQATCS
jgi:arylformamidase